MFFPAILISVCDSSSPAFHMMYSAYKLNKQSDNMQPWGTLFPIWNQSVVPCPVLTVASWPAYRFLRRQARWFGISISYQAAAFTLPPQGVREIILATNIAETGITIPDVVFVIDTGRTKENKYHESSQMSSLVEMSSLSAKPVLCSARGELGRSEMASVSACTQEKGMA